MHIGQRIKEVMRQKRVSVISIAREISCERTNIYNIFDRKDINTALLQKFSTVLQHDFFKEMSQETFGKRRERTKN
jgi:hypothetical protein